MIILNYCIDWLDFVVVLCGVLYTDSISVSPTPNSPWIAVGLQPGKLFRPKNNKLVYCLNSDTKKVNHIFDAGRWGSK